MDGERVACMADGHVWPGGVQVWQGACIVGKGGRGMRAGEMATEAGGTHLAGMHSSWIPQRHFVHLLYRICYFHLNFNSVELDLCETPVSRF